MTAEFEQYRQNIKQLDDNEYQLVEESKVEKQITTTCPKDLLEFQKKEK